MQQHYTIYQDIADPPVVTEGPVPLEQWWGQGQDFARAPLPRPTGGGVFYVEPQPEIVLIEKHFCQPPVAPPRRYPVREGGFVSTSEAVLPSVAAQMDWLPDCEEQPPLKAPFPEGLFVYPLYATLPAPPAFHDAWQPRDTFPPRRAAALAWEGLALSDATIYVPPVPVERWMPPPADVVRHRPREQGCQVSTPLPIFTAELLPPLAEIPIVRLPRQPGLLAEQLVDPLVRVDHWMPATEVPAARRGRELCGISKSLPLSDIVPLDRWFEQPPDLIRPVPLNHGQSIAYTTLGLADVQLSSWFVQASEPVRLDPFLAAWTRTPTEVLPIVVIVGSGLTGTLRTFPRLSGKLLVNP